MDEKKLFDERVKKFNLICDTYKEIGNQQGVSEKLGVDVPAISKTLNLNNIHYGADRTKYNPRKRLNKPYQISEDIEYLDKYDI